jgi:hypothetical protein
MTEAERKPYNTVYEKLVQRDDDLIGLIAYALYKQHKRDWLIAYRQREDREPSVAELSAYLTSQELDRTVLMYRERAEAVLNQFAEQIIDRATPDIQRSAISSEISRSLTWWRQLPAGIFAAIVYSVLLILIALVLRYAGIDFLGILSAVGRP